jgi:hypothetical protein
MACLLFNNKEVPMESTIASFERALASLMRFTPHLSRC